MINLVKKNIRGFTLIEVLLVVAIFVIMVGGAATVLSSRVYQDDLKAKSEEIVDMISRAQNYSRTGFQGDVWGIKVLDNDSSCPAQTDCIVMFKGESYSARNSSYDQFVSLNNGNSSVYIESSQEKEFYFYYGSGFLSTSTEQEIVLNSNFGDGKTVRVAPSGLAYIFSCGEDKVFDIEGRGYNTVKIGNQCWMSENLNIGTMLSSAATDPDDNGIIEKWCEDNDLTNCDSKGGLYSWNEAMDYATSEGYKGICPNAWHIPTEAELDVLEANYPSASDGTELKVGGGSGFNLIASNQTDTGADAYNDSDLSAIWSSTENSTEAYYHYTDALTATMDEASKTKNWGFSVRCLKDY